MPLCNLPVNCIREPFKPSKDSASLLVCNEKNFKSGVSRFFVDDIIIVSGIGLGLFGRGYWALDLNCKREVFRLSF